MLELSGGGQRLPLSFSASFPRYISSFLASSPLNNLTDFGMKGSECLADGKGGDGVLAVTCATCEDQVQRSSVMCMWSVILSGPCSAYCRSVIV